MIKKEYMISISVLLVALAVSLFFSFSGSQFFIGEEAVIDSVVSQETITSAFGNNWTIDGDSVYTNDDKVFIKATPHTIANGGWVEYEFVSKVYTGDVDLAFGFNKSTIRPTAIQYYNPHQETETLSYTCDYEFNYTTNPKYFWCYETYANNTVFIHKEAPFDWGDIPLKTAYKNVTRTIEWSDMSANFERNNFNFEDTNTWWIRKNIPIVEDNTYRFRIRIEKESSNFIPVTDKYWFAIKPSVDTLQEAIQKETLYALDPWVGGLDVDLISYWKLDEASNTTLIDERGKINISSTAGSPIFDTEGIIETSVGTESDDEGFFTTTGTSAIDFGTTQDFSVNVWVRLNSTDTGYALIVSSNALTDPRWTIFGNAGTSQIYMRVTTSGAGVSLLTNGGLSLDEWHMITFVRNNSGQDYNLYIDGVANVSLIGGGVQDAGASLFTLGNPNIPSRIFNGRIDELGVWGRRLMPSEITELYNGGSGLPYVTATPDSFPSVILNSPANGTTVNYATVNFNASVYDDFIVQNVSLYVDGIPEQTNTSKINNTDYIFTRPLSTGIHNWSIVAYDNASQINQSETRWINISVISPTIQLSLPANNIITTNGTKTMYGYVTDDQEIVNVSLYVNSSLISTNTSGLKDVNYTFTYTFSEGISTWYIEAYDNDSLAGVSSTRTIDVDSTLPQINITIPEGIYPYANSSSNFTLSWTASDDNLDTCWYNYGGLVYVDCGIGSLEIAKGSTEETYSVCMYSNDTAGNTASDCSTFDYKIDQVSHVYNANSVIGSTENFLYSFIKPLYANADSAYLEYDGTNYSVVVVNPSVGSPIIANGRYIDYDLEITTTGNNTFYYYIFFNDGSVIRTPGYNQEIQELNVDDCSSYTNVVYNFTMYDEGSRTKFSGVTDETYAEIDLAINSYGTNNEINSYNNSFNQTNPFSVCIDQDLSGGAELSIDATVRYTAKGRVNEFYNLQMADLTEETLNTNISLYSLNENSSTEFVIDYRDSLYQKREGVLLQILRRYIGDSLYLTVEIPKTSTESQALGHFDTDEVEYKIIATLNGVVLNIFDNPLIDCESELTNTCIIYLNGQGSATNIETLEQTEGYASTIELDNDTVGVTYSIPSGTPETIRLEFVQKTVLGTSETLCNYSIASAGGSYECDVNPTIGDSVVTIRQYVDGELKRVNQVYYQEDLGTFFLDNNYVIIVSYLIILVTMAVGSPMIMVIATIFGVVISGLLFLLNGYSIGLVAGSMSWLVIAGIIILMKLNKKDES